LIFGPGIPQLAHQPDEYIEIETYLEAIELYCDLAVHYLGEEKASSKRGR
jgi:succinyl-diaminopimelate desuccinylase